jgi:hypothetical protein
MFLFLSLFLENMVSYVLELKGNPCGLGERRNINKVKNLDGFLSISGVLNLILNLMRNQSLQCNGDVHSTKQAKS